MENKKINKKKLAFVILVVFVIYFLFINIEDVFTVIDFLWLYLIKWILEFIFIILNIMLFIILIIEPSIKPFNKWIHT